MVLNNQLNRLSNKVISDLVNMAENFKNVKLIQSKLQIGLKVWIDKMMKLWPEEVSLKMIEKFQLNENSVLFLAFGDDKDSVVSCLKSTNLHFAIMLCIFS